MPLFEVEEQSFLKDFVRVENTEPFIKQFKQIYYEQVDVLYNHSPIFPFSYLNKGRMELYLHGYLPIPLVKKFKNAPKYWIHCPGDNLKPQPSELLGVIQDIELETKVPVDITDLTSSYANKLLEILPGYKKFKTSDDIIQDAAAMAALSGRNNSSLRNTLNNVEKNFKPEIQVLSAANQLSAISIFEEWKEVSIKKYFRITVGRDIRLIREYYDKIDLKNIFGYVYFVDTLPAAVSFGCRSWSRPEWGIDVTVKALYSTYKGLADFAFIHLMQEMHKQGIMLVNDSGGTGKVKLNKQKFHPIGTIPMFDLRKSV